MVRDDRHLDRYFLAVRFDWIVCRFARSRSCDLAFISPGGGRIWRIACHLQEGEFTLSSPICHSGLDPESSLFTIGWFEGFLDPGSGAGMTGGSGA